MKGTDYIRCPRCELNFIQKKDKYCSVCKAEMSADPGAFDDLDSEICPICKTNFIRPDEIMCTQCAKEHSIDGANIISHDDWDTYTEGEDDGVASVEEETGDMASVTDLDEVDDLEETDLPEINEEFEFDEDDEPDDEEEEEEESDDDDILDDDDDDDDDDDEDDDF